MLTNFWKATPLYLLGLLMLAPPAQASPTDENAQVEKKIVIEDDNDPVVVHVTGRSHRGYLGVGLVEITPELRAHFGVSRDAGVLVGSVKADSPAAKAGIEVGDIITKANGESVDSTRDLSRVIRDKKAGDSVKLEISRNHASKTMTATVAERRVRSRSVTIPEIGDIGDLSRLGPMFGHPQDWKGVQDRLSEIEKRLDDLEKTHPTR